MSTRQTNSKKQHKHLKRKDRHRRSLDIGTPKVPLSKNLHQQSHELLSDWENAT